MASGAFGGLGACVRLIAWFMVLAWAVQGTSHIPSGSGHGAARSSLSASQPVEHRTIVARDHVRMAVAENARLGSSMTSFLEGDGKKPLGLLPEIAWAFESLPGTLHAWVSEKQATRLAVRAFDARGPPILPA